MSPYQNVNHTKNTKKALELLEEVDIQKQKPRHLKERARHVIRSRLKFGRAYDLMPLPLPIRLKQYLRYPELEFLL